MLTKIRNLLLVFLLLAACSSTALAQESVTLSISPTLYDMSAEPGQTWKSNLRIVNVNPFDLTVYVDVVNFAPKGEGGDGRFLPVMDTESTGDTLAEWITISREAITVPQEQTMEIPFMVKIPEDASPGGHFAAILVGTKPIQSEPGQARLQTAQMVTSLFFARVAGDVIEAGTIREFTTERSYLDSPEATFALRFENKGNVHLQPQGEIKIYNMWGEERGVIPINQYSNFGNVLPASIRKFSFTWKGEWSVSDIGRYTAIATLGYGVTEKKFTSSKTVFWVIPFKLLLGIVFGLFFFFITLTYLVRLYVRHMLTLAGISLEDHKNFKQKSNTQNKIPPTTMSLRAPVQAGILDLTKRLSSAPNITLRLKSLSSFVIQYRLFFLGVILVAIFVGLLAWYITNANTKHRAYEVLYKQNEATTAVTSEEILYDQLKAQEKSADSSPATSTLITVDIINRSGTPGAGARAALKLEKLGYQVGKLEADFEAPLERSVILYVAENIDAALTVSELFANALVSVADPLSSNQQLTLLIGSDIGDK
jgi:LytR cell envelope-related transcriptional attenuator